jgi:hypothetical protein
MADNRYCEACGKPNRKNARFCGNCGELLYVTEDISDEAFVTEEFYKKEGLASGYLK